MNKAVALSLVIAFQPVPSHAFTASDLFEAVTGAVSVVCAADPHCVRRTSSILIYLYRNPDLHVEFAKCGAWQLTKRGYIWSPLKSLDNMSKVEAMSFVKDTCTCTLGFWAERICEGNVPEVVED